MNVEKYKKKIKDCSDCLNDKEGDREVSHIVYDKLFRQFVKDIANNKLTNKEIEVIAKEIEKFNKKNKINIEAFWYA